MQEANSSCMLTASSVGYFSLYASKETVLSIYIGALDTTNTVWSTSIVFKKGRNYLWRINRTSSQRENIYFGFWDLKHLEFVKNRPVTPFPWLGSSASQIFFWCVMFHHKQVESQAENSREQIMCCTFESAAQAPPVAPWRVSFLFFLPGLQLVRQQANSLQEKHRQVPGGGQPLCHENSLGGQTGRGFPAHAELHRYQNAVDVKEAARCFVMCALRTPQSCDRAVCLNTTPGWGHWCQEAQTHKQHKMLS